jgi:hypothetical protein
MSDIHPEPIAPSCGLVRRHSEASHVRVLLLACIILGLGTLVLPVALTRVAPLLDYPNHLARIWLLAGGAVHAPLDGIYRVD